MMLRARILHLLYTIIGWTFLIVISWKYVRMVTSKTGEEKFESFNPGGEVKMKIVSSSALWHDANTKVAGCKIPYTPTFPKSFNSTINWVSRKVPDCSYEISLSEIKGEELVLNPHLIHSDCCMQDIRRKHRNDSLFDLSTCTPISRRTNVSFKESILIKCGNSVNLETFIPLKEKVKQKILFWEKVSRAERPISILLLGIDSVSRAHAYRSLPQTMKFMKKQGFVDFNQYHSIAPSTFTNFLGFLTGMTRNDVRSTCAPDWVSPVDKCPLIWKDFDKKHYVTSYTEDWGQTFSWGGQSGFEEEPTDYYLHTPFVALRTVRNHGKKSIQINQDEKSSYNILNLDCASNNSVPQHIFNYFLRFSKQFEEFPYFAFTWINNPIHEKTNALPHFDDMLLQFFQTLLSNPAVKKRLLIVFLSDHGARTGFFQSTSIESFVERGLPPLLIHVPDTFRHRYPKMVESLLQNRQSLITPFDIHHSLLHVASLSQRSKTHFDNARKDRSTVFQKVQANRSCESLHIPKTFCLCNIDINSLDEVEIPYQVVQTMLSSSVQYLNSRIQASKYKDLCESWKAKMSGILYTKLISSSSNHVEHIMAFATTRRKARFESRIYISVNEKYYHTKLLLTNHVRNITVIGMSRISKYGDQSLCVQAVTDSDKEIKELCWCKVASYESNIKNRDQYEH